MSAQNFQYRLDFKFSGGQNALNVIELNVIVSAAWQTSNGKTSLRNKIKSAAICDIEICF